MLVGAAALVFAAGNEHHSRLGRERRGDAEQAEDEAREY